MQGNNGNASLQDRRPANAGYYTAKKHLPCPYEGCEKKFTCNHNILQHVRESHTFERPYECESCEKVGKFTAFTRPASLYRHQRDIHNIEPDVGSRGRPRVKGPQGPRRYKDKKGVGRNDSPKPVIPLPSENRINVSNDPSSIDPRLLQQIPQTAAPNAAYCFTCDMPLPDGLDARLVHGHLAHNDECRPSCGCTLCIQHFSQQVQRPVQEQQPVRPQIITSSTRDLNNGLLDRPLAFQQPPVIQQPRPIRTLDLNTLSALDEKLKRVQAMQSPRPGPSRMIGMESSGASGVQRAKAEMEAVRSDSGIGFGQGFEMGEFTDYAAPDFTFEDVVNDDESDGNVAADGMIE